MSEPSEDQLKEIGMTRDEYDKLVSDLREKGYECLGFAVHPDVYEKEIQRLESELDSLKKCYATTNESWCKVMEENAELRREVEHYRKFYIAVTNSDPVQSFVGGDPVGYLATNGMLKALEKEIGDR